MTSALVQKPFTVLVEGNIGCGKTTFLQHFSEVGLSVILKKTLMGPPRPFIKFLHASRVTIKLSSVLAVDK